MIYQGNLVQLSYKDGKLDETRNIVIYDNVTYLLYPLNKNYPISKGGNSSVFEVRLDENDLVPRVIKISNVPKPSRESKRWHKKRYGRFINEIDALSKAKEVGLENIVEIDFNDIIKIDGLEFPYYVMEKADADLKEYVYSDSNKLDNQEKIKFCIQIFNSIKQLFGIDYYHRDIKPDNIFLFFKNTEDDKPTQFIWKIGDLGLVNHREKDYDEIGERIGPFGWISPEAMNKYLTEKAKKGFDCKIDEKSDIFQLGKMFWFILVENCPMGEIYYKDFDCDIRFKRKIWSIMISMMAYVKSRRPTLSELEIKLDKISELYGI